MYIQWNLSFGTPLFKWHLHLGDTTFGPRKMLTYSLYLFPLVKGHFYSWERVSFSILDSTSIQGTPYHSKGKARFRRRTFHEPNLTHWIKYMKSSASESIRNACFNLERLSRSFRLARPGISPLDRLWTPLIQTPNFSCTEPNAEILITYFVSSLTEMCIFRLLNLVRLELRSASESL